MRRSTVYLIGFHFTILCAIYALLSVFGIIRVEISDTSLLRFDAGMYNFIKDNGYVYIPNQGCSLAFFPLFPYFWSLLSLSAISISLVNFLLFALGLWIFFKYEKDGVNPILILTYLSIPSVVFFVTPYSESLFFLICVCFLIGMKKNFRWLKYSALFAASLTRSISIIFLPAIVICELFDKSKTLRERLVSIFTSFLISLLAVGVVTVIQYYQTGKLLYFIEVQKYWGREWNWIKLPIITNNADAVLATDSFALFSGIVAFFYLAWFFLSFDKRYGLKIPKLEFDPVVVFSLLYIVALSILDTFFTSNYRGTNIWSINRHIFATPFFLAFLSWLYNRNEFFRTEVFILIWLVLAVVVITALGSNIISLLHFGFYFLLYICLISRSLKNFKIAYAVSVTVQIFFVCLFLSGGWLG